MKTASQALNFEDIKFKKPSKETSKRIAKAEEQVNLQNIPVFKYMKAKYFQHERGILRFVVGSILVWHFFNVLIVEFVKGLIH